MNLSDLSSKRLVLLSSKLDGVYLWLIQLDSIQSDEIELIRQYLNKEEIMKMNRFHQPLHQQRYGLCRFLYKMILGKYLDLSIRSIEFSYTSKGKPYLKNSSIHFNLSHSHEVAIAAISLNPIGVDIERIDCNIDLKSIMNQFFTENEISWVQEGEEFDRFFQIWTTKEAIQKCSGEGITAPKLPGLHFEGDHCSYPSHLIQSFYDIPGYVYTISIDAKGSYALS